jgi:hypothetical protein
MAVIVEVEDSLYASNFSISGSVSDWSDVNE